MMFRSCTVQVNLDFSSEADMVKSCASASRCSRSSPQSSPTHPSWRAGPTVSRRSAPKSGAIPIPTAPACFRSRSKPAWGSSATSTMRSVCRCISSIATAAITTWPAKASRIFSKAGLPMLPGQRPTLQGLVRPSDDDLSRSAVEEVSRDARRRFRSMAGPVRAARPYGSGLLYDQAPLDGAWDLVKDWTADRAGGVARRRTSPGFGGPRRWPQRSRCGAPMC